MSSRFGTRTYTRQKVPQSNIQFENVFNEKSNRPTASKSAGILHKWGKTSFTSIRSSKLNGQRDVEKSEPKRPKLVLDANDPFSFDTDTKPLNPPVVDKQFVDTVEKYSPPIPKPNKFFKSGNRGSSAHTYSKTSVNSGESKLDGTQSSIASGLSDKDVKSSVESFFDEKSASPITIHSSENSNGPTNVASKSCSPVDPCFQNFDNQTDILSSFDACSDPLSITGSHSSYQLSQLTNSENVDAGKEEASETATENSEDVVLVTKRGRRFFKTYGSNRTRNAANSNKDTTSTASTLQTDASSHAGSQLTASATSIAETNCSDIKDSVTSSRENLKSDSLTPEHETRELLHSDDNSLTYNTPGVPPDEQPYVDGSSSPPEDSQLSTTSDSAVGDMSSSQKSDFYVITSGSSATSLVLTKVERPDSQESDRTCSQESVQSRPGRSRRIFNSPKKQLDKKALYKHKAWQAEEEPMEDEAPKPPPKSLSQDFDFDEEEVTAAPLVRVTTWPTRIGDEAVTSIKCSKKTKELYTVVRNVKQAHQCHEIGETQEFNDDIEYLLDGLQNTIPLGTRCLSVLSLAAKCMAPSFRMHLRAHGTISKIFCALSDAPSDENLALCTATVMFILSQDRLNMDLERSSLELMLALLEKDVSSPKKRQQQSTLTQSESRELERNLLKVRELCEEVQKKGNSHHLNLDNISSCHLAMETLLSLTSRRAGEWFKEELRELGGLDHINETVAQCVDVLESDLSTILEEDSLEKLSKIDRCLRVLESVTLMNSENQAYLIQYKSGLLMESIVTVLRLCTTLIPSHPVKDKSDRVSLGGVLFSCIQSVLRVLINLTHENPQGSICLGDRKGAQDLLLQCVFHMPKFIPSDHAFDLLVLSLGLLINMVEHSTTNRRKILNADIPPVATEKYEISRTPAVKGLVDLFLEREEAARLEEAKTDSLLDGDRSQESEETEGSEGNNSGPMTQDDLEDTLAKALQKAGKHMEMSMGAAYIALLLGCLIQEGQEAARTVRDQLPMNDFKIMVKILEKFLNFMSLTATVGNTGMKSIQRVIDVLESS